MPKQSTRITRSLFTLVVGFLIPSLFAEVQVLQKEGRIPVWGWAVDQEQRKV